MTNLMLYILIGLGSLLLLVNLIDIKAILAKLTFRKRQSTQTTVEIAKKEVTFLEIVGLWYQLKTKCDDIGLTVASEKLDEVFPLLNGSVDNEQKTN